VPNPKTKKPMKPNLPDRSRVGKLRCTYCGEDCGRVRTQGLKLHKCPSCGRHFKITAMD